MAAPLPLVEVLQYPIGDSHICKSFLVKLHPSKRLEITRGSFLESERILISEGSAVIEVILVPEDSDGVVIYEGEIRMATGDLLSADTCSEVILFTLHEDTLRPIAEHDEASGYYTKDISDEWMANMKRKVLKTRPSTAELVKDRSRKGHSLPPHHTRPTTAITSLPVPHTSSSVAHDEDINIDVIINELSSALNDETSNQNQKPHPPQKPKPLIKPSKEISYNKYDLLPIESEPVELPPLSFAPTFQCRRITIHMHSNHGDKNYIGLCGIEVLGQIQGSIYPLPLSMDNLECIEPSSSSMGVRNDEIRYQPENLLNGINNITDDRFMWMVPYTPPCTTPTATPRSRSKSNHFIQIDLKEFKSVTGLCIYNFNKPNEALYRGVKDITIELDGRFLGHWVCRLGVGCDGIKLPQKIFFQNVFRMYHGGYHSGPEGAQVCIGTASGNARYVRYLTPSVKQEYETQVLPSGLLCTMTLLDNWGDDYFIGLDMIQFIDPRGKIIDFSRGSSHSGEGEGEGEGAMITAYPHSLRDLHGYEQDDRLPSNLIRKQYHTYPSKTSKQSQLQGKQQLQVEVKKNHKVPSWLTPISCSMTVQEKKESIHRTLTNPKLLSSLQQQNKKLYAIYQKSYENIDDRDRLFNSDGCGMNIPQNNKVWIAFPYPIAIAGIRLYNYSKTPMRGVKDFTIELDGKLIFQGTLQPAESHRVTSEDDEEEEMGGATPQTVLFTNDVKVVRMYEKEVMKYCGMMEQDVLYINERQVMVRSKDMYHRKPSVTTEGVYADINNRPSTSMQV